LVLKKKGIGQPSPSPRRKKKKKKASLASQQKRWGGRGCFSDCGEERKKRKTILQSWEKKPAHAGPAPGRKNKKRDRFFRREGKEKGGRWGTSVSPKKKKKRKMSLREGGARPGLSGLFKGKGGGEASAADRISAARENPSLMKV